MRISLLHPSRSRPQKSYNTIQKWIERAGTDLEVIVSLDFSDVMWVDYVMYYGGTVAVSLGCHDQEVKPGVKFVQHNNRSAVDAINAAAKHANGDIFIVVSDDTDCPENWAVDLLKHLEGKDDFIAKVDDGIQSWIITMPIMDQKYYGRFGYIYHPEYLHLFCDTELSAVADMTGRRINIPMTFKHLHYSTGACEKDSLSDKADATWKQGEDLFLSRYKHFFDLDNPLPITDRGTQNWINTKLRFIR